MAIDPKKATPKQIEEALALLEKENIRKDRIARGEIKGTTYKKRSEMSPEELKKVKEADKVYAAGLKITLHKAKAAGLQATETEIDTFIKTGKMPEVKVKK